MSLGTIRNIWLAAVLGCGFMGALTAPLDGSGADSFAAMLLLVPIGFVVAFMEIVSADFAGLNFWWTIQLALCVSPVLYVIYFSMVQANKKK